MMFGIIASMLFVADWIGQGRISPWLGLFVLCVLVNNALEEIYQIERKKKNEKLHLH